MLCMPARNLGHPVVVFVAVEAADHSLHVVRLPSGPRPSTSDSRIGPCADEPTGVGISQFRFVQVMGPYSNGHVETFEITNGSRLHAKKCEVLVSSMGGSRTVAGN